MNISEIVFPKSNHKNAPQAHLCDLISYILHMNISEIAHEYIPDFIKNDFFMNRLQIQPPDL